LPAQTRKNPLRPSELIENPNTYLNQSVDLEILEPLYVGRSTWFVLSMEPVVMGPPHRIASLDVIKNDPAQWDRKQILDEGIYQTGFEVSVLDEMWLDTAPSRIIFWVTAMETLRQNLA